MRGRGEGDADEGTDVKVGRGGESGEGTSRCEGEGVLLLTNLLCTISIYLLFLLRSFIIYQLFLDILS